MVTTEEYIWLFDRRECRGMSASILGSLLLHSLIIAILASTAVFHPLPGESDKVAVLWYYPDLSPGRRTTTAGSLPSPRAVHIEPHLLKGRSKTASSTGESRKPPQTPAKTADHGPVEMAKATNPPLEKSKAAVPPLLAVPPEEAVEEETEPEMKIPAAKEQSPEITATATPVEKPPEKKKEAQVIDTRAAAESGPLTTGPKKPEATPATGLAHEETVRPTSTPDVKKTIQREKERDESAFASPIGQPPAVSSTLTAARKAAVNVAQPLETNKISAQPIPAAPVETVPIRGKEMGPAASSPVQAPPQLAATAEGGGKKRVGAGSDKTADKQADVVKGKGKTPHGSAGGEGIFFPKLKGDLKLEVVGGDEVLHGIRVSVLFREFPKARRNRPLTRWEYSRARTITPPFVISGENTRQAVIETTGEGIYEFSVESVSGQPIEAVYSIKLYDNGGRGRVKPLGSRRIGQSESLVKVLMPEGVLWNEEAAFSGSIEDSESLTKFNSDTGLLWREYGPNP